MFAQDTLSWCATAPGFLSDDRTTVSVCFVANIDQFQPAESTIQQLLVTYVREKRNSVDLLNR